MTKSIFVASALVQWICQKYRNKATNSIFVTCALILRICQKCRNKATYSLVVTCALLQLICQKCRNKATKSLFVACALVQRMCQAFKYRIAYSVQSSATADKLQLPPALICHGITVASRFLYSLCSKEYSVIFSTVYSGGSSPAYPLLKIVPYINS